MTVYPAYQYNYTKVKYLLRSYRALSDGRSGIHALEAKLKTEKTYLFDWKVTWVGACTLLRSSIDLIQVDVKSCLSADIRKELKAEWSSIKSNKAKHRIFWEFLREERNNIIHQYEWGAYEQWLKLDGTPAPRMSLLMIAGDNFSPVLKMRGGTFEGCNSIDLLHESAEWAEERIFSAISRAGLDPEEERNILTFAPRPPPEPTLLPGLLDRSEDNGGGTDDLDR